MVSAESFWTPSLRLAQKGEGITRILAAAVTAVNPEMAIGRCVRLDGNVLSISDRVYDLRSFRRVILLGMGKASIAMANAMVRILEPHVDAGLVITKHVLEIPPVAIEILQGDHPIPGSRSLEAGRKTCELLSGLHPDDLLFCLISGGGSALVSSPLDGISLEDIQVLNSELLACGARIDEINTLRRRLDKIKGGGIAKMAAGASIISLILSDVVGNPLEAIASGPTVPDPSTRDDAFAILEKYKLGNRIPISILNSLRSSPETPKTGDPIFLNVVNVIVGSNLMAAQAALAQADKEGFHPYLLRIDLQGEARLAAVELATCLRQARSTSDPVAGPACIVVGGETTVTLRQYPGNDPGKAGRGGRNTELALGAVTELADFPGAMLITLATDGEDGSTDSAGAVVTGDTFRRAAEMGMNPGDFLDRNDSYSYFSALEDLLKPGPTGTNVNDLVFLFFS